MKKLLTTTLLTALMLSLAACGSSADTTDLSDQVITRSTDTEETVEDETVGEAETEETVEDETEEASTVDESEPFYFEYEGVVIMPGEAFDASALPTADSVYTVASCAIEGDDNVYNYTTFEVTAFDDGTGEVVYSIYFIDPNITTPEGLALGDSLSRVEELYGTNYAEDGTAVIYTRGETQLSIILQNEIVVSIEYLLVL
ncbi:MAG: hypothetical protein LUI10_09425 [Lachnospiraceae bacterium]|nr:hypothetical protein [Lachnospiraceae bacterium]